MYDKIYVVTSYKYQSGGTESAHQLVGWLNDRGICAFVYYYDTEEKVDIPEKFKKYNVKVAQYIIDSNDNMLVTAETLTEYLYKYKHIKKAIWWLSLNYYLYQFPKKKAQFEIEKYGFPAVCKPILTAYFRGKDKREDRLFDFGSDKNEIIHFYNCEYVKRYLLSNGVLEENIHYLCGPIRDVFFIRGAQCDPRIKENLVLYNPNKGLHFTKKIINASKGRNFTFVPIEKMTPNQIVDLMERAKVYIDFGDFPGPERIPREAVTMRCNILVGKVGSAKNNIDVPIPDKYKISRSNKEIDKIVNQIEKMVQNNMEYIGDFDIYRDKIARQEQKSFETIEDVFGRSK